MTTLSNELSNIISALEDGGIEYAVSGGLALTVYGVARASYSFDFLIRAESFEKIREVVGQLGYIESDSDRSLKSSSVEVHCISKIEKDGDILPVKFVIVNSKVEDVWETREKLNWQEKTLWIVSREGLIKMKQLAGRAKDLIDIDRIENEES